ncbi:MAG: hypothetical protein ACOC2H_07690 [Spirochaetota bacterium]
MQELPIDLHEAVLLYTHTKIELARRIREGIGYADFIAYEEKLQRIDKILKREEKKLRKQLERAAGKKSGSR